MLLATLEYLREYRTYDHIAFSYDVEESSICRGIRWVEDTLIKDGTFSLPGRKALLKNDVEYDVILERVHIKRASKIKAKVKTEK